MSSRTRLRRLALSATLCLVGCGGGDGAAGDSHDPEHDAPSSDAGARAHADADAGADDASIGPAPTYAPTLTAIYREILEPSCGWVFCHGGDLLVDFSTREQSYDTLVGRAAEGTDCRDMGLVRVVPGDPDASLLFMKVTEPPCGRRMPLLYDYSGMLEPRQIAQIREWIALGAPND